MDGRLLSEASALNSSTVSLGYNLDSQRETLSLNGAEVASYRYQAGLLEAVEFGSQEIAFEYDDLGRRTRRHDPNGVDTSYTYHPTLGWLERIRALAGEATVVDVAYGHDDDGDRISKTTPEWNETYSYDRVSQLLGARRTGSSTRLWRWADDPVGNRTSEQVDGLPRSFTHDRRNRLLTAQVGGSLRVAGQTSEPADVKVAGRPACQLPGNQFEVDVPAPAEGTFAVTAEDPSGNQRTTTYEAPTVASNGTYSYDPNRNLVEKVEASHTWTYEWTVENQLVRALKDGVEQARFRYDPFGRRAEKVAAGATTRYLYDGMDILRESRSDGTTWTYVHGPGIAEPLARQDTGGQLTYYHADGLGSIVKMTDQAGAVVQTRQYDAWGNLQVGAEQAGYAFTGREWDPEIGLYYYRARYYDPMAARFISEDPIGFAGGMNAYGYVGGNPTSIIDPLGLKAKVTRNGNDVSVLYRVNFRYKKGATPDPALEQRFRNAVAKTWTGTFGKYKVTTKVECGNDNYVDVYKGRHEVYASGKTVVLGEVALNRGNIMSDESILESAYSHEAAHVWGLEDGYNTKTLLPLIDPATGQARTDIMAMLLGPVTEANIDELLQ